MSHKSSFRLLTIVSTLQVLWSTLKSGINLDSLFQAKDSECQMQECDGFIVVYDLSSPSTLKDVMDFYPQILRNKQQSYLIGNGNVRIPIVIVGNKRDLVEEGKVGGGAALAQQWGCRHYETSAKIAMEVQSVFDDIIRQLKCSSEKDLEENNRTVEGDMDGIVNCFCFLFRWS